MKRTLLLIALLAIVPLSALALSSTNRVETSNTLCAGSFVKDLTTTGPTFDDIATSELPSDYTTSDKYCIKQTKTTQCSGAGGATTYAYALYNTSGISAYTQGTSCTQPSGLDSNGEPYFPKTGPAKVWTNTLRYITPTATLTASPTSITPGSSSLLTWSSNQSSCTGTGFNTNNAANGSVSVSPSNSTTYTVTCGSVVKDVTVSVVPPVSLTATKDGASVNSVAAGTKVTFTWSSVGADYCTGTNIITGGATSGSVDVYPDTTKTYSVECFGSSSTSGPGTWQDGGTDYSDYYCFPATPAQGGNNAGVLLPYSKANTTCPSSVEVGASCTAPAHCKADTVEASCGISSQYYYCQATGATVSSGSASVTVSVTGGAPTTPTFTTPGLTCPATVTVGAAATFTLSASDPDGDQIHYGMDWDNTSTVDEWKPSVSTYVASGVKQDFSHTWNTTGTYTIKGLAEDTGGNQSGWAQCTVTVAAGTCADGQDNDNDHHTDAADPDCSSCPQGSTCNEVTVDPPWPPCYGLGCESGPSISAGCLYPESNTPDSSEVAGQCCSMTPGICPASSTECSDGLDNDHNGTFDAASVNHVNPDLIGCDNANDNIEETPAAALSLVATPSSVTKGNASQLTWSVTNAKANTCTITSDTGFSSTLHNSQGSDNGSVSSGAIQTQTLFTLTCQNLAGVWVSKAAKVEIKKSVREE